MGAQIEKIFKVVEEKAGMNGRIQLASRTGISRTKALELPDNPEDVAMVKNLATEIVGQSIEAFLG